MHPGLPDYVCSTSRDELIEDYSQGSSAEVSDGDQEGIPSPPPPLAPPRHDYSRRSVPLNERLCPCTETTEGDVFLMCLALGIRHGLSWHALVDILKFVNVIFGRKVVKDSKYNFLKYIDVGKDDTMVHVYCPDCEGYLGVKDDNNKLLHCNICDKDVGNISKSSSYYVSVTMNNQFKEMMESPGVAEKIMTSRCSRQKDVDGFEDIYDGEIYKKWCQPGQILSEPQNLSVTINTDGLALGESSAQSAWPILLSVNELPHRDRKKHMIYAGMWVGNKQPNMTIFLKSFVENLNILSNEGFNWTNAEGAVIKSKVIPLLAVLDSGARYKFLNLSSFSSYMGCTFCYQRAENTRKGRRFTYSLEPSPLRTHQSMLEDMQAAHNLQSLNDPKKQVHRGCKGFTPLVYLHPYLDLGAGVVVDFMHNALLGVCRSHMYNLMNTPNTPYYIGNPKNVGLMNEFLVRIRPPLAITRTPRELKHLKLYKASEWRSFLIFYGIICFHEILERKYLVHFSLLSASFQILLKRSISLKELNLAKNYLNLYVQQTEKYFGKEAMTYNVHLLLHVAKSVSDWGPIWGYSTFDFEGENHFLSKMHTSPGRIALQLTRRYLTFKSYPSLCEKLASSEKPLSFISNITGKKYINFLNSEDGTLLLGKFHEHRVTYVEHECILKAGFQFLDNSVQSYSRFIFNNVRFTTQGYSEGKKNDDSWILAANGKRGFITKIFNVLVEEARFVPVIIIREVIIRREPLFKTQHVTLTHIKRIENEGSLFAISPHEITGQCIYMKSVNAGFIADIPYGCYGD